MKTLFSGELRWCWSVSGAMLYAMLASVVISCVAMPTPVPAAPVPAAAQDAIDEIDQLFSWVTPETPGCAVGAAQNGEVVVNRAYGSANLERGVAIDSNTVFDIGSVQKQFVAAAILLLVDDGVLTLSDDVRTYFPEMHDYGHTITIDHLLTHTSGLRDWTALLQFSHESEAALPMILRQRSLNFVPGEEWSYSNSGYVLLKEILARTTGMPFSEFAAERLFEPLGMEMTTYADDVREVEDRALAYEREGDGWRLNILVGNERGDGGALLSTAGDMLIWNEALTNGKLGTFVTEKLQEPARLNDGRELSYARGLFLDENPASRIVWHSGSAAGYKAFAARLLDQGLSIAILCNAGDSSPGQEVVDTIVDLFAPAMRDADDEANGRTGTVPSVEPAADPSSRAGLFFREDTGAVLRLGVQRNALHVDGGPELVPVAPDRYRAAERTLNFMSDDEVELHFVSPDTLELTISQGEIIRYRRGQPYAPTGAELEAFAGRYESDELRAVLDVMVADDDLMISLNGSPPFALTPVDADTFQLGRMLVRFLRDEDGEVGAIDYSNPVLYGVRFTRVDDAVGGD